MDRARTLLPEYLLDLCTEAERREVEAEMARSPELALAARQAADDLATLPDRLAAVAATAAVVRAPAARARLLATVSGPDRFRAFFPTLAGWFDLGEDEVRAVLARVDDHAGYHADDRTGAGAGAGATG